MKKLLLPIFVFLFIMTQVTNAYSASSLEISTTADFSSLSTNFAGGQTIFVRLESGDPSSAQSSLNLRDNGYNLINSYKFKKEGNFFSAIIPVPYDAGYYSLEGVIEYDGSSTKSVKTVKVGSPSNASVKVNVNSNVSGSSTNVLGESGGVEGSEGANDTKELKAEPKVDDNGQGDGSGDYVLGKSQKGFVQNLTSMVKEILDFLWPF